MYRFARRKFIWAEGLKLAFQYDINGMKQSDPNAYAEVWTMNADGSGETSTGVQCSDSGCAPRWQPHLGRHEHKRPVGALSQQ